MALTRAVASVDVDRPIPLVHVLGGEKQGGPHLFRPAYHAPVGGDHVGGKAVHQFRGLGFTGVTLPITERLYTRALLLPMNTTLTDDDVSYIVDQVRAFYGRGL